MSDEIMQLRKELATMDERMKKLEGDALRDPDLVPLNQAPQRYHCSEATARRKAKNGFGVKIFGRWFLLHSKVMGK
jgi:hypothetical protein